MINTIKNAIKTKLDGLQLVGEVNTYERVGFGSIPAVNVTMAGNDSNFWSVASNQRGYNFTIRVFITRDKEKKEVEDQMGDVIDSILEVFDTDITLNGNALFLRAAPSTWGYIEAEEGYYRTADINLQIIKNVNVRS